MTAPPENGQGARSPAKVTIDVAIRLILLGLFAYLTFVLIRPFLPIVIWASILTVALYPIFAWLRARLGGNDLAAAVLLTIISLAVVFGPAAVLTSSLVVSLEHMVLGIRAGTLTLSSLPESVTALPYIGEGLHRLSGLATANLTDMLEQYGERLLAPGAWLLALAVDVAESFLAFAASVVVAGFFYLTGPKLALRVNRAALRIAGPRGSDLVALTGATIRNVARGVIGVAALQALLVGVGLIVADVPHAGLLTLAVLVLATIQVGIMPIVVPLIIWFWLTREPTAALLFTLYMGPAGLIDSVLKPLIMGKGLQTPILVIFIGVLGGTVAYGLPGLFLGPMILALAYELVAFWLQDEAGPPGDEGTA